MTTQLYVYAIRRADTREVKLGISGRPLARLADLQTSSAHALSLAFAMPGDRALEATVHAMWADCRRSGEWFVETPELTMWIEEQAALHGPFVPSPPARPIPPLCGEPTTSGRPCRRPAPRTHQFQIAGGESPACVRVCEAHLQEYERLIGSRGFLPGVSP